jgi:hypothetical protein
VRAREQLVPHVTGHDGRHDEHGGAEEEDAGEELPAHPAT